MQAGELTTFLVSDTGRIIGWTTNGTRVMLMLLENPGDAGVHAIDPGGRGQSGGYVMDNGQLDTYMDADTVPLREGQRLLASLLSDGGFPPDAPVQVDR